MSDLAMKPVERALDLGLIVLQSGGSTEMADRTFRNVLKGYRQEDVSAAWRIDFVAACSRTEGRSETILRPVGSIGANLNRTSEALALGERAANGEVDDDTLAAEIGRIKALAPFRHPWKLAAVAAFTAMCYSQLCGGDWGAAGIAFTAAGLGQLFRYVLQSRKLAVAPVTLASGVFSACLACIGLRLGLSMAMPAVLIPSVIYLVPGLPLINGFVDMVSHRHLFVGLERVVNAVFLFMVLAIAIALAYTVIL